MWIRRNSSKSRGSDETFGFNIRLSKVDIKKPLQKWLHLELESGVYLCHSEEEIRDYLRQNAFSYLSHWFVNEVLEWAFKIGLREGYICRSGNDQDSPVPMYYIPMALLDVKCGPKRSMADQYNQDYDVVPGVSAYFEEQKPVTRIETKNTKVHETE